ncbi:MAG: DMT family transporter [Bacteroidales bacterium]|nr:DMT family transporter [Bacteroidales bacterium]
MTNSNKSYLFALLAIISWSTIATAFKLALNEITPGQLLLIASVTSTIVLFFISLFEGTIKSLRKTSSNDILMSALLGFLNPFIYYLALLKAYSLLPAQVAQPLNMIWPIILVLLSVPLLKQKIAPRSFIALFISFAGVYLISSQGQPLHPGKSDPIGIILAAGSSIFWALYFILNLKDSRAESVKLFMNFFIASIFISVYLILTDGYEGFTLKGVGIALYVGVFEMSIPFLLWLKALSLAKTSARISNLVFLAPFLSLILINSILGEKIHYTTPIGLLIIISGIVYQNYKKVASR